jgi:hypothetical protein
MQVYSEKIIFLVGLASIFLIAFLFLVLFLLSLNKRKKKYLEEKKLLKQTFENELFKTQMEVQEQTLKTIAHDLHDNIGQLLSLITITLSTIDFRENPKIEPKLILVDELTNRSIKELKALSKLLHGEELISNGLINAIEYELAWIKKSDHFTINFKADDFVNFQQNIRKETVIFRLFQESINNIIQHAQATKIDIQLKNEQNNFVLTIQDNGIGFNLEEKLILKGGMGINNLKRRANLIGGNVIIESVIKKGTKIVFTIPCN